MLTDRATSTSLPTAIQLNTHRSTFDRREPGLALSMAVALALRLFPSLLARGLRAGADTDQPVSEAPAHSEPGRRVRCIHWAVVSEMQRAMGSCTSRRCLPPRPRYAGRWLMSRLSRGPQHPRVAVRHASTCRSVLGAVPERWRRYTIIRAAVRDSEQTVVVQS